MKPQTGMKKFRKEPKYEHKRSEGLTRRGNGGTRLLTDNRKMKLSRREEFEAGKNTY